MKICNKCGKETDLLTYSGGKFYCEDCYQEIRKLKLLASG